MSALGTVQHEFVAALFAPGEPTDAGVAVYRRNVLANLAGALASTYPVVRRLVGEAFFDEAARRHALAVPSKSGDLNRYGATFAEFLAKYGPARELDYLPDVARLEWALHQSDQAADAPTADLAALARVAPGDEGSVRLSLHPAVRLVASQHPILAIWEANQPGRDGAPDRELVAERVLVRRGAQGAVAGLLDAAGWKLLVAFEAGASLDEAVDALGDEAHRLPQLLSRFAAANVLRADRAAHDS